MKTFADMPLEEHEECVGMWCDFEATPGYVITTIIIKAGNDLEFEDEYEVFNPIIGHELAQPEQITPRFDLPRACSPDGHSPAGEWEYLPEYLEVWGEWKPIAASTTDKAEAESWVRVDQFKNVSTRIRKRWVGDWEPVMKYSPESAKYAEEE